MFSVLPASRWQGHGREADRRVVAPFLCDRLPFRRQDAGGTLNAYRRPVNSQAGRSGRLLRQNENG